MSFEQVGGYKFIKSNSLKVGESIEGFVVGKYNSKMYPDKDSIIMSINGESIVVNAHGSLQYFFSNNNKAGYYYRFTRLEDKMIKNKASLQWKIEVDRSKTIECIPMSEETHKEVNDTDSIPF
jgi:hypothetical protein